MHCTFVRCTCKHIRLNCYIRNNKIEHHLKSYEQQFYWQFISIHWRIYLYLSHHNKKQLTGSDSFQHLLYQNAVSHCVDLVGRKQRFAMRRNVISDSLSSTPAAPTNFSKCKKPSASVKPASSNKQLVQHLSFSSSSNATSPSLNRTMVSVNMRRKVFKCAHEYKYSN